jgi:hypothetical protein
MNQFFIELIPGFRRTNCPGPQAHFVRVFSDVPDDVEEERPPQADHLFARRSVQRHQSHPHLHVQGRGEHQPRGSQHFPGRSRRIKGSGS